MKSVNRPIHQKRRPKPDAFFSYSPFRVGLSVLGQEVGQPGAGAVIVALAAAIATGATVATGTTIATTATVATAITTVAVATAFPPGGLPPVGWWGTPPAPA